MVDKPAGQILRRRTARIAALACNLIAAATGAEQPVPKATLIVFNLAKISEAKLARAEKETAQILGQAGILVEIVTCPLRAVDWAKPGPCELVGGPNTLRVLVESRKPPSRSSEMLGYTVLPPDANEKYAGVYYPMANEVAENSQTDVEQVLGAAMAHEVGHLLLGAEAHSPQGLMKARWEWTEIERISIGTLLFSSEQAARLRAVLARSIQVAEK